MSRRNIPRRSIGAKKLTLILSIYLSEAVGSSVCVRLLKEPLKPHPRPSLLTKVDMQLKITRADAFSMIKTITKNILQVFCSR